MTDQPDQGKILQTLRQMPGICHPAFGDLKRSQAVQMPRTPLLSQTFREQIPYCIHLSVTGRCNARCKGCVNTSITFSIADNARHSPAYDVRPERDAQAIIRLLEPLGETDVVVSLYGGEPLLVMDKIEALDAIFSARTLPYCLRYMLYTNGLLLGKAVETHPELLSRIWLYAVSIDGTRQQHNTLRLGTDLELIHRNLARLQPLRTGQVLMWSTLREEQSLADCFDEFLFLYGHGYVNHFFWHWIETSEAFTSLDSYITHYEIDLAHIMEAYVSWLSAGKLLPIAHLNELILYLITAKQRGTTSCAVEEQHNYDIIGGRVHACADLPMELAIGTIDDDGQPHLHAADLRSLVAYKDALGCHECGVHPYCGGRCPVQALTGSPQRLIDYCQLMRLHVGTVQHYLPEIIKQLARHNITLQDIYDRSAFIAQFTDVTP